MEILVNRSVLLEELSKANKIIDVRNVNPSLSGVLLEVGIDNLTIVSTNGSLSYKSILNANNAELEIKEPGKLLVKTKYILDMLRKIEEDFVSLVAVENNELKIITKKVEFNINTLSPDEYPLIGFRERGTEIIVNAKEFKHSLAQTIISINEWNKKIALTGSNLKTTEDKLIISTTDMHRISQKSIPLNNPVKEQINIIIPFKTIVELPKFLDVAKEIKIVINEGYATFIIGQTIFQTNLIDGQFPTVDSVFPTEFANIMTVDSKILMKTLSRADLPNEDGLASTINLKINQGLMLVKTNIIEVGHFEEEFTDFKLKGEGGLTINFNSKFLQEAIKTFDGETIELKFVNSTRAVVINKVGNENLKQVVLPTYLEE